MKRRKETYGWLSVLSIILFVAIWWFSCDVLKLTNSSTLPGPVTIAETFIKKLTGTAPDGATLPQHIFSSLRIALGGWAMGVVIGTPLGIFMAWYKKVDLFVRPLFDLLRPVPGLAWIPLMIILFGIGLTPKIVTVFLSAFVPCVINSYTGIRQTKDVARGPIFWLTAPITKKNTTPTIAATVPIFRRFPTGIPSRSATAGATILELSFTIPA